MRPSNWFIHLLRLFSHKARSGQVFGAKPRKPRRPLSPGRLLWQLGDGWQVEQQCGLTYLVCPNRRWWWPVVPLGWGWIDTRAN